MIRRPHLRFSYFWVFEKILIEFLKNWVSFFQNFSKFFDFSRFSSTFVAKNNITVNFKALWHLSNPKIFLFSVIFSILLSKIFRIFKFLEKYWVFGKKLSFLQNWALSFVVLSAKKNPAMRKHSLAHSTIFLSLLLQDFENRLHRQGTVQPLPCYHLTLPHTHSTPHSTAARASPCSLLAVTTAR